MRTIVWQSHYLLNRGCSVTIRWNPRCCALGPALADAAASLWKFLEQDLFSQAHLPVEDRDGILDKLHRWTDDVISWEPERQVEEDWDHQWEED